LSETPQGAQENPASSALQFYTEFANPSKTIYSWNRGLASSQNAFVAGDLAMLSWSLERLRDDSQPQPQPALRGRAGAPNRGGGTKSTFGQMTGVAVSRSSPNQKGALAVALKLTSQQGIGALAANSRSRRCVAT